MRPDRSAEFVKRITALRFTQASFARFLAEARPDLSPATHARQVRRWPLGEVPVSAETWRLLDTMEQLERHNFQLATILGRACDVLGSPSRMADWLNTPALGLNGVQPSLALETEGGRQAVAVYLECMASEA